MVYNQLAMKKWHFFLLGFIFFIAFFLRFYKLGEVPFGFYQDESAIGYNAYSIIQTGKDEYGKSFPLYFKSFGDWKLPVYIYSSIIPIKIFGLNEFAVRFPSALFGALSVIVFYFFASTIIESYESTQIRKRINANNLAITATFLFAINPWSLHYNRATFEVSISLFLFLLGGLLLYKSFDKKKSLPFVLGTLCFIISLYSYNLTRLLAPALYFLILFLNRGKVKAIRKNTFSFTGFISLVFLVPFIGTFFGNGGFSSASGTLIFSSAAVQSVLLEFRSYFVNFPSVLSKLMFNNLELTLWQYLGNIASYFSVNFFFVSGSTHGNHGIGNVGQFYLFEFPLVILGIIWIIREKPKWFNLFLFWGVITILVASLTRDVPQATRSFFLIVPFEVLSAIGVISTINWVKSIRKAQYKWIIASVFVIFVSYNLFYYFASYYVRFPVLYAKSWRSEDKPISLYIKENEYKYDKIIFDEKAGFVYGSLLFYLQYSPSMLQSSVVRAPDDSEGFSRVNSFGKYEFRSIDWTKDNELERTLIVTNTTPSDVPILKTFFYPKRPVVISVGQNIMQYPVEDAAYVLVETK
ncbi:MAG: hypothetical protein Q8P80_03410 [Candidatus Levybacteria bacterium]|nr:hypothetical protein [Candidatus Levybacteria bacterium]